jgi:hypothetical protein
MLIPGNALACLEHWDSYMTPTSAGNFQHPTVQQIALKLYSQMEWDRLPFVVQFHFKMRILYEVSKVSKMWCTTTTTTTTTITTTTTTTTTTNTTT